MNTSHNLKLALAFLMLTCLSACGGGNNGGGNNNSTHSSIANSKAVSSSQKSTGSSVATSASNSSAEFGLTSRPSNTTCAAPALINAGQTARIEWLPAFPSLPNIAVPSALFQLPGNNTAWYVLQQSGIILRFDNQTGANTLTSVLNIEDRVDFSGARGDETGLLGVAVHPQFSLNRFVFLYYTGTPTNGGLETRVARFTVNGDGSFDPNSELIMLRITRPYANHLGGQLAFDSEGYLYVASGDGGSGGDPDQRGQNLNTLLGKILRIDVNKTSAGKLYAIPTDNPFIGNNNIREEIWAWGLRNPWRFSFDSETNELWAGDVGQKAWEEINLITRGGNYGWGDMEGDSCYVTRPNCSTANKIKPFHKISQTTGACSVIGGYVYRGKKYPTAFGKYFFTDYCEHTMRSFTRNVNDSINLEAHGSISASIVSFAQDNLGELYAIGQASGTGTQIFSLQASSGGQLQGVMANKLSDTGCVLKNKPTSPASGMIPYGVESPLWSDGAAKERYLALPDSKQIIINTENDFNFPVGSVLMKHFTLDDKLIETRLFSLDSIGWQGFSYEWLDDQSDAILLNDVKDKMISGVQWHFPSRGECLKCHTRAAGFSLGAEAAQLNGNLLYETTGKNANQLIALEHIGLFSTPLTAGQKTEKLQPLNNQTATLEQRARSYLHSNCSNCHRPGGQTPTSLDLRYNIPLADTRSCDVIPHEGDLGIANARILKPGNPQGSVLIARMLATNDAKMPPLSRTVVDTEAVKVISDWISSLSRCSP
jgi:uncharacterized repeat protein (TIGR03806 family)